VVPIFSPKEIPCEDVIGAGGDVGVAGVVVDCLVVPFVADEFVGAVFVVATELLVLDDPAEVVWLAVLVLVVIVPLPFPFPPGQHSISWAPGHNPATKLFSQ
jgi:hypothetical protein